MRAGLALARRGLGQVAPNPAVGCVLVKQGRVIGRGWTAPGGRPHAETEALARAGAAAKGATAYVTLEPCAHHGQTGPCADALVAADITRCVVALRDPDPRVGGQGLARLRAADVAVEEGLCASEAAELNAGYLLHRQEGRPLVTLKLASSLDGKIATASGESRWITGETARARVHLLRAEADAVMVGGTTARHDDPRLDCRLPGLEARSPLRVVMDGGLQLPLASNLVENAARRPTLLLTGDNQAAAALEPYRQAGVEVATLPRGDGGRLLPEAALRELARRGVTRLLIEGGGKLAASFLQAQKVDRLIWFRAPRVIGAEGHPAIAALGLEALSDAPGFERTAVECLGADIVESYRAAP